MVVESLITTRLRTFRTFGSWFETSVLFAWVLVFPKGIKSPSNKSQEVPAKHRPFPNGPQKVLIKKLVDKLTCS